MSIEDYTGHWVQAASPDSDEKLDVSCTKVTYVDKVIHLRCTFIGVEEHFITDYEVNGPIIVNLLHNGKFGEYSKDGPTITWFNGERFFTTWTRPGMI